jgi:hypothetical protein
MKPGVRFRLALIGNTRVLVVEELREPAPVIMKILEMAYALGMASAR